MKAPILVLGALIGASVAWFLIPRIEVVEAAGYDPVPQVATSCDAWTIRETGPDYYWDGEGTETQTSTADYWTVETLDNGTPVLSEPAEQGEAIVIRPAPLLLVFSVVWWDADRSGEPEELSRVRVFVEDC
jgi:hypothetical protein